MPRDLLADQKTLDGMPQLSRESASSPPPEVSSPMPLYSPTVFVEERFKKMKGVHPFAQLLNRDDLDDCDWLEHAAFDPIEAATREKVSIYKVALQLFYLQRHFKFPLELHLLYYHWAAVRRQVMRPSPCSLLPGSPASHAADALHRCFVATFRHHFPASSNTKLSTSYKCQVVRHARRRRSNAARTSPVWPFVKRAFLHGHLSLHRAAELDAQSDYLVPRNYY